MLAVTRRSGMMLWLAVVSAGCSTVQHSKTTGPDQEVKSPIVQKTVLETGPESGGKLVFRGQVLEKNEFDIPVVMNTAVEHWIDYFTGRGRPHFERYLERSELFIPFIRPILKESGLPQDLVYQAMIESGFANHARSTAKAVGPWQFIPATGRRYGLMVNWWVDERRDTRKSTVAAGNYLKDLYTWFGSWELAAAAYNAGEAKIAKAIQRFGTKNFWALSRNRYLRRETRDYVPKIMAAAIVAKNRLAFGFPASYAHLHEGQAVSGDGEVVEVKKSGEDAGSDMEARPKDPSVETLEKVLSKEDPTLIDEAPVAQALKNAPRAQAIPTPMVDKKGALSGIELAEFELSSPADLLKIAEAAGISYSTVKGLNPEILRWVTPPSVGAYRVKLPATAKDKFLETYNHPAFPKSVQFLAVKVRGGETLGKISRHFGIKVDPLVDLNGVGEKALLRSGTRVLLPLPLDRTRSLASLDVRDTPERRRLKRRAASRAPKVSYKKRESARGTRVTLSEDA